MKVSCCLLAHILVLLCLSVHSAREFKVEECLDQQEVCECTKDKCNFTLRIEELQTFTSYEIDDNGIELTRGTPGNVYYLNESGYHPAPYNRGTAETDTKRCVIENETLVNDEDFCSSGRNCSIPMTVDGETYRLFIAVNGRIPGPTLIVNEGAIVKVRVENELTSEGVTIHWHGMHQRGTPWMDGVGFISQAPITPGAYFDYVFKATPPGTHWYHSHLGAQRTDGLFGALIVRETSSDYKSDIINAIESESSQSVPYSDITDSPGNHTLTLLDWQREASLDLFVRIHSALGFFPQKSIGAIPQENDSVYEATRGPDGTEVGPIPYWSGLINGRGRRTASTYSPLSVFPVTTNKAYRFRIVGAQSVYAYSFSIDEHMLTVIATDGHFIRPVTVDYIIVHSGERYDFILNTFNKTEKNYWIRAETLEVNQTEEHSARAVLKYGDGVNATIDWTDQYNTVLTMSRTCTSDDTCRVLNCPFERYLPSENKMCVHLTSLTPLPRSSGSTGYSFNRCDDPDSCTKFFNFGFEGISVTSAINGKNFKLPATPYQTNCGSYDEEENNCTWCTETSNNPVDCRCVHVEKIMENEQFDPKKAKTVIMVFSAVGIERFREFSHPVHLHGHSFHVLHIGYGNDTNSASPDVSCNGSKCLNPEWANGEPRAVKEATMNLDARILKDTVNVPARGYVAVSFTADNPGYWFLHCHIEVHQLEGMGVLIEEYPHTQHRVPPEGINRVGNFRLNISDFETLSKSTCSNAGGLRGFKLVTIILGVLLHIFM